MKILLLLFFGVIVFFVLLIRSSKKTKARPSSPTKDYSKPPPAPETKAINSKINTQKNKIIDIRPVININYRSLDMEKGDPTVNRTVTINKLCYRYLDGKVRVKPAIHGHCHLENDNRHFKAWRIEGDTTLAATGESAPFEQLIHPPKTSDCKDSNAIGEDIDGTPPTLESFKSLILKHSESAEINITENHLLAALPNSKSIEITYTPPFEKATLNVKFTRSEKTLSHELDPYTKPWKLKMMNGKSSSFKSRVSMMNRLEKDLKEAPH